jgi:RNA polymerase sigma-70 factor, ECF subfamily
MMNGRQERESTTHTGTVRGPLRRDVDEADDGIEAESPAPPRSGAGSSDDPDTLLMLRVRDGDHQAFHEIFLKFRGPLLNFSSRFIASSERCEELVQEAFLQVYRARERYEPQARLATYLYRVMINLCLNERRRFIYHGRMESLEQGRFGEDDRDGMQIADQSLPPVEDYVAGLEIAGNLKKLLKRLPPNQRAALLLSRIEGFSYREVADCLDTSVSAVKSLVFRATQSLREGLKDVLG